MFWNRPSIKVSELIQKVYPGKKVNPNLFEFFDNYRLNKVSKFFRLACQETRITDCRFHDCRHTFASKLVQSGVDLYKVQLLLGHKSPLRTVRYSHHNIDSLRVAISQLSLVSCQSVESQLSLRPV